MDNNSEKERKAKENLENFEKLALSMDNSVKKADEKLAKAPDILGAYKYQLRIAVIAIVAIALFRDPSLLLALIPVLAILNLSKIVAFLKKKGDENRKMKEITNATEKTKPTVKVSEVKKEKTEKE